MCLFLCRVCVGSPALLHWSQIQEMHVRRIRLIGDSKTVRTRVPTSITDSLHVALQKQCWVLKDGWTLIANVLSYCHVELIKGDKGSAKCQAIHTRPSHLSSKEASFCEAVTPHWLNGKKSQIMDIDGYMESLKVDVKLNVSLDFNGKRQTLLFFSGASFKRLTSCYCTN